ncbi:N-acetylmuramic acid 6-phosphate etherase [Flavitalea sp.]|nr:N-acetylmuramic acid 6-phosphate etherase [Flavitalea sp.]
MSFEKITESVSHYRYLERMSVNEILTNINNEDKSIAYSVEKVIPQVEKLVNVVSEKLLNGGRLFYIGAGTSGRLGVLDASECPPTYGVPEYMVTGIMAGGDGALRNGVEDAEDDEYQGWKDLEKNAVSDNDVVIGIAASGSTPYVAGALRIARENNIVTGCIVCNPGSEVAKHTDYPIEVTVGPEFVTGSTRMKSGTAQKLILNMISTAVMIRLGRVEDNRMVNMQISNDKLLDRGVKMLMEKWGLSDYAVAKDILLKYGNIPSALKHLQEDHKTK